MPINQKFFYDSVRRDLFGGMIRPQQMRGMRAIVQRWEQYHADDDLRWLAYMLATVYHETARTMQPVRETLAPDDDTAIARLQKAFDAGKLANVQTPYWQRDEHGQTWLGRGLVQLTHKRNYAAMSTILGVDLLRHPERAMTMEIAVRILFYGMIEGTFSGIRLGDVFNDTTCDWVNARRIVNQLDRAMEIAIIAQDFYAALGGCNSRRPL